MSAFKNIFIVSIGVVMALLSACSDYEGTPYTWQIPDEFPLPQVPLDNPMTFQKVELGRHLFYDKHLSGNAEQACGSCHQQRLAFSDGRVNAVGSTGEGHRRNSLALVNIAYNSTLTWAHPELQV
ncbi:MAG: di-heme enzyme, partial [Gammaproteobacteria bacterium]|nr:di-heme enzyme [Gammaproteobacteria bacterium]